MDELNCSKKSLEIVQKLISIPTVSRDSNLGIIEWIRDYLKKFGIKSRMTYDKGRGKANLFATVGECKKPGIVLSGHTDVVPVDGQQWDTDPFVPTLIGDKLFGRGTADMKSFIGISLAMIPQILESEMDSAIHLAFSYDEELGCIGVRELIKDLEEIGLKPAGCIVGEPTDMKIIVGHKGKVDWRCCVKGVEAHSSLTPYGVNAIEYAAKLIVYIRSIAEEFSRNEQRHFGYDVPYSTINTGTIRGGLSTNTVAKECEFTFDLRYLPTVNPEKVYQQIKQFAEETLLPEMRKISKKSSVDIEQIAGIPSFNIEENAAIVDLAKKLNSKKFRAEEGYVAFGTEASLFQKSGIPTVLIGPGSISQAHKPNEYITLGQIAECEQFLKKLIEMKNVNTF